MVKHFSLLLKLIPMILPKSNYYTKQKHPYQLEIRLQKLHQPTNGSESMRNFIASFLGEIGGNF
jgi:hypothetical protein